MPKGDDRAHDILKPRVPNLEPGLGAVHPGGDSIQLLGHQSGEFAVSGLYRAGSPRPRATGAAGLPMPGGSWPFGFRSLMFRVLGVDVVGCLGAENGLDQPVHRGATDRVKSVRAWGLSLCRSRRTVSGPPRPRADWKNSSHRHPLGEISVFLSSGQLSSVVIQQSTCFAAAYE